MTGRGQPGRHLLGCSAAESGASGPGEAGCLCLSQPQFPHLSNRVTAVPLPWW